jgi:hypothetical protein
MIVGVFDFFPSVEAEISSSKLAAKSDRRLSEAEHSTEVGVGKGGSDRF